MSTILGNPITLGGGGAKLNIDFGTTPPSDTSKLWVPLATKPDAVECNPVANYGDMYAEYIGQTGGNTSYTPGYQNCMIGDWIYFIGPYLYDTNTNYDKTRSKYLRRYNVKTYVLENVIQVYDGTYAYGGYRSMCGIALGSTLYFFGGVSYTGTNDYIQNYKVYIYNTETNTGNWTNHTNVNSIEYTSRMSCCSIGDKIYITNGYKESESRYPSRGSLYEFDTNSLVFTHITSLPGYYGYSCFSVKDKVYVFGGSGNNDNKLAEIDPNTKTLTIKLTNFPVNKTLGGNIVPCLVLNDVVLVFGNTNYNDTMLTVYKYDITNNAVINSGNILLAQAGETAWGVSGNSVYFLGGNSYNVISAKVQKFTIQTELLNNHLFLQEDYGYDGLWTALKSKDTDLKVKVINAYLGDSNNIAQLTNAYLYDSKDLKWKSLSGESYVADMLNALNVMGVN